MQIPMVTTESGLQYKDIKIGEGPSPPIGFQVSSRLRFNLFFNFFKLWMPLNTWLITRKSGSVDCHFNNSVRGTIFLKMH